MTLAISPRFQPAAALQPVAGRSLGLKQLSAACGDLCTPAGSKHSSGASSARPPLRPQASIRLYQPPGPPHLPSLRPGRGVGMSAHVNRQATGCVTRVFGACHASLPDRAHVRGPPIDATCPGTQLPHSPRCAHAAKGDRLKYLLDSRQLVRSCPGGRQHNDAICRLRRDMWIPAYWAWRHSCDSSRPTARNPVAPSALAPGHAGHAARPALTTSSRKAEAGVGHEVLAPSPANLTLPAA